MGRAVRGASVIVGLALAIASCCRGNSSHSCDLTPPTPDGGDAAADGGPVLCGTEVCDMGTVCCLKKSPPLAGCIDPAIFESFGCEKMPLPCLVPADCPAGMACCLMLDQTRMSGTVSCQPLLPCLGGDSSLVACVSDADCPGVRPTCTAISSTSQGDFKVCE